MSEIIIHEMKENDAIEIARIHCKELYNDFLPSLGANYLEKGYYKQALKNPHGKVFVASKSNQIIGFVNIANDSRAYLKYNIIKSLWILSLSLLKMLFISPSWLREGFMIAKSRGYYESGIGEIMFIAVDQSYQKQGIGKMLIDEANKYFSKQGIKKAFTKTKDSNNHAINMYKKYGAEKVAEIKIIDKKYIYLRWNTNYV